MKWGKKIVFLGECGDRMENDFLYKINFIYLIFLLCLLQEKNQEGVATAASIVVKKLH
jgi:hypothetical protein